MSRLPLHTVDDAPEAAQAGLELVVSRNGFLPNLFRILANSPAALEAYHSLSAILTRGNFNVGEREAIQITAAATQKCGICVAGHTALAYRKAGLEQQVVDALRDSKAVPDARLDALAHFTRAVLQRLGNVTDDELKAFYVAGYDEGDAVEVILGVSLATLCNFTSNLGRPSLNPELAPYAWKDSAAQPGRS
jgi:AhpD family alkylhydroperoxidase